MYKLKFDVSSIIKRGGRGGREVDKKKFRRSERIPSKKRKLFRRYYEYLEGDESLRLLSASYIDSVTPLYK